ncbi:MAG: TolC family protein [Coxiellaceae bacterium]|nr:TolC family protein [Coxiellaceae bacterium]
MRAFFHASLISFAACLTLPQIGIAAPDLRTVLISAIHQNPGYQQDIAEFHVIAENVPQRRSVLLPQLDSIAEFAREREARSNDGHGWISTNNLGLDLNQTIWDANALKELDVAKLATRAAAYNLLAQQQELIIEVANAYLQILQAQDLVGYTQQQYKFSMEQVEASRVKLKHGEATITEFEQSDGRVLLLKGELISAKINLYNAKQALYALTNKQYKRIQSMHRFPLIVPKPNRLSAWLDILMHKNLTLIADQYSLQSLQSKVTAAKANYLPVLTAVSTYSTNQRAHVQNNIIGTNHRNTFAVGANMTWPIFQGGLRPAQVRQTTDEYLKIYAKLHEDYLGAVQQTKQSFNNITKGIQRIRANRRAMATNQKALNHAEEGYRAGTETVTDVLQIQTQLFSSQQQYATDYYAYMLAILQLKQAAGILSVQNLLL